MNTLIIHPKDKSTGFLEIIYQNIKNKKLITGNMSKSELRKLISDYDRIMMMGHGSPFGLFSIGRFEPDPDLYPFDFGHIIDYSMVEVLKDKPENVYIWCNADQFVKRYKLQGFYSGMFVSEVTEGLYCGIKNTTQELVDESNMLFCKYMNECIEKDKNTLHNTIKQKYGELAETNPIASYNNDRLYVY